MLEGVQKEFVGGMVENVPTRFASGVSCGVAVVLNHQSVQIAEPLGEPHECRSEPLFVQQRRRKLRGKIAGCLNSVSQDLHHFAKPRSRRLRRLAGDDIDSEASSDQQLLHLNVKQFRQALPFFLLDLSQLGPKLAEPLFLFSQFARLLLQPPVQLRNDLLAMLDGLMKFTLSFAQRSAADLLQQNRRLHGQIPGKRLVDRKFIAWDERAMNRKLQTEYRRKSSHA